MLAILLVYTYQNDKSTGATQKKNTAYLVVQRAGELLETGGFYFNY
jgi:hypothetical protein